MITPKYGGASSALCHSFFLLAYRPHILMFSSRFLPFALLPTVYLMYEIEEYRSTHVNEVSPPAHFASAILGITLGLLFRLK